MGFPRQRIVCLGALEQHHSWICPLGKTGTGCLAPVNARATQPRPPVYPAPPGPTCSSSASHQSREAETDWGHGEWLHSELRKMMSFKDAQTMRMKMLSSENLFFLATAPNLRTHANVSNMFSWHLSDDLLGKFGGFLCSRHCVSGGDIWKKQKKKGLFVT